MNGTRRSYLRKGIDERMDKRMNKQWVNEYETKVTDKRTFG